MQSESDAQLLRAYAERGAEAAFTELVHRHTNLVYSAALRQVESLDAAAEIAQRVFIGLARGARDLAPRLAVDASLAGWLCRSARNLSLNHRRDEFRRQTRERQAMEQLSEIPDAAPDWERLRRVLDEAMSDLSEADYDALVLRFFQQQDYRTVGVALGVSDDTAQKRVSRALETLRDHLSRRGIRTTAAALSLVITANAVQAAPVTLAKTISAVAVAKGAAASGSTLTKGTLKIMASIKAKTTLATAVIAMLGATWLTTNAIQATRAAHRNALHDIQGTWEGDRARSMGVNRNSPARNRMVLRLFKNNGDYTATADLIDWGRKNIPVAVDYSYPSLHLSINPDVKFDATVNTNDTRLNFGSFMLERTNAPDQVPEPLTEAAFTSRAGSDLQGYWKGTIDTKPNPLPLNLKITEDPDGIFRAEVDNPNQGAMGMSATVIYRRPTLQLMLNTRDGMLQGEVNGDNTEIKGSWLEPRRVVSASFKRADFETEHAQDNLKDYTFRSASDLQGHWQGSFLFRNKSVEIPIALGLDIAKLPDGTFSVTATSLYNLSNGDPKPASDFQYAAPNLEIAWKWMNDRFVGQMKNGKLVGNWISGNKQWPIVFKRKPK